MKWLILLLFTILLNANNFPLIQAISVQKNPITSKNTLEGRVQNRQIEALIIE